MYARAHLPAEGCVLQGGASRVTFSLRVNFISHRSLRLINVHLTRLTLSITDVLSTAEYPTKDFFESSASKGSRSQVRQREAEAPSNRYHRMFALPMKAVDSMQNMGGESGRLKCGNQGLPV